MVARDGVGRVNQDEKWWRWALDNLDYNGRRKTEKKSAGGRRNGNALGRRYVRRHEGETMGCYKLLAFSTSGW